MADGIKCAFVGKNRCFVEIIFIRRYKNLFLRRNYCEYEKVSNIFTVDPAAYWLFYGA